jgi:urea carboxylase-associated protein 2
MAIERPPADGVARLAGSALARLVFLVVIPEGNLRLLLGELVLDESILWQETLPGNATWSHILKRGTALRLTALDDAPNVGALLLNADNFSERLNLPDTLKAQHIARLTTGAVLYSDMARILCSITHDTVGWHDPLGGCSDAAMVAAKYGALGYQQARNSWHQNALDGFLIELAKYGLGPRDLGMNVNFFSKVEVEDDGSMHFITGNAVAGDYVELRAEMNTLLILNSCQHSMDPAREYAARRVELTLKRVPAVAAEDVCRLFRTENQRGFTLTERYFQ